MMRLIYDQQIRCWQGDLVCSDGARVQSLDARNLDWVREIGVQACLYDAVVDQQFERSLLQDLAAVGQDQDTLAALNRTLDEACSDHRLAASGGNDQ
jgi:hypothetical protein